MLLWGQRAALCGCRLQCCDFLAESGDFPNPLLTKATDDKCGDFYRCCYKRLWFGDSDLKARYHGCFHGAVQQSGRSAAGAVTGRPRHRALIVGQSHSSVPELLRCSQRPTPLHRCSPGCHTPQICLQIYLFSRRNDLGDMPHCRVPVK